MMAKIKYCFLIASLCFCVFNTITFATITGSGGYLSGSALPRGYDKAPIYRVTLRTDAVANFDSVKSIQIFNNSTVPFSSSGIWKVVIEAQNDSDASPIEMASKTFDASELTEFTFPVKGNGAWANASDTKTIKIYYYIDKNAKLEWTSNFELGAVLDKDSTAIDVGTSISQNYTISGMNFTLDSSFTPKVVVPGSQYIPYASMSIAPQGESFNGDLKISLYNDAGNFGNGLTNSGITYVTVCTSLNGGVVDQDSILTTLVPDTSKPKELELVISKQVLEKNVTKNIYIAYNIGRNTEIGGYKARDDRRVYFQIKSLSWQGADSGLDVPMIENGGTSFPVNPRDERFASKLGGLRLEKFESIVPSGLVGKGEPVIPMAWFSLSAQELALSVNEITLVNTGNINYVQSQYQKNGLTVVSLYKDSQRDGFFDGPDKEQLITAWPLGSQNGYGVGNGKNSLTITGLDLHIVTTNWVDGMTEGDYDSKAERFFLVYSLGDTVQLAGTINIFTCNLQDSKAASGYISQNILLSGAGTSYNVIATASLTNLRITGVQSIDTPTAYERSQDVPLLTYELENISSVDLTGILIHLLSNTSDFSNSDKGIAALKLYRDSGNGYFDASDVLEGRVYNFTSPTNINLPPVNIKAATPAKFFVLADNGASSSGTLSIQIDGISSTSDMTGVVASGSFPMPIVPIFLAVTDNQVVVSSVQSSANTISKSSTYNVNIVLTNNNLYPVNLNQVMPKFYKSDITGADLSYEYSLAPLAAPITLAASSTVTLSFAVNTTGLRTAGSIQLDAWVQYNSAALTRNSTLTRYKNSQAALTAASAQTAQWNVVIPNIQNYILPGYIQSITEQGSTKKLFDKDTTQKGIPLVIQFSSNGSTIAGESLSVSLNGKSLNQDPTSSNYYYYSNATGKLTLTYTDQGPCKLALRVKDAFGNQLDDLNFNFFVSNSSADEVGISNLLTFPNPFRNDGTGMKIGYNLMSPATVKFYLVNMAGEIIWQTTEVKAEKGSYIYWWDAVLDNGTGLSTGAYLLYAIAENAAGGVAKTRTKIAVW